jgi:hypothetical protein
MCKTKEREEEEKKKNREKEVGRSEKGCESTKTRDGRGQKDRGEVKKETEEVREKVGEERRRWKKR